MGSYPSASDPSASAIPLILVSSVSVAASSRTPNRPRSHQNDTVNDGSRLMATLNSGDNHSRSLRSSGGEAGRGSVA